jgi:hypothetical protein
MRFDIPRTRGFLTTMSDVQQNIAALLSEDRVFEPSGRSGPAPSSAIGHRTSGRTPITRPSGRIKPTAWRGSGDGTP